ncbi:Subtilisin-like protease [Hordeum vulgare]|nr:Subtilisin-like protease [Hordeum vulgare]
MADAHPNSGGPVVDQPGMAKKKKAKAPRKPRAECTPEEIVKLDAESVKRRNRRATVKDNAAARKFTAEHDAMEAARRKIEVEEKEDIVNKAHTLLMLGICRLVDFSAAAVSPASTGSSVARSVHCQSPTSRTTTVSPGFPSPRHDAHTRFSGSLDRRSGVRRDAKKGSTSAVYGHHVPPPPPRILFDEMATPMSPVDDTYDQFMEDVIYNDVHVPTYDPDETQSQDGRAQFVADEEADDRADYDHGGRSFLEASMVPPTGPLVVCRREADSFWRLVVLPTKKTIHFGG